ncbi:MAG: ATP-dependent DNA helicase RecG [Buchananella hordeovulneris]|nr:ATP-dependent DNA helicase RecG [Buchananella hordeovulneris]
MVPAARPGASPARPHAAAQASAPASVLAPTARELGAQSALTEPLAALVGAATAKKLAKLGLHTGGDLLEHFPRRYEQWGDLTPIAALAEGSDVTVQARVVSCQSRPMRNRGGSLLAVRITDGTSELALTFFAKHAGALRAHENRLRPGTVALFAGTVSSYRGTRQLTHPDYEVLGENLSEAEVRQRTERPIPVYGQTAGLPTWVIARAVGVVLDSITAADVPDAVPARTRAERGYPSTFEALQAIHRPRDRAEFRRARRFLAFQEAFVLQAALAQLRAQAESAPAPECGRLGEPGPLLRAFDARLPFELTAGQREVGAAISADLCRPVPMQRLLQGDVGAGKTIVALRAMLQAVDAGAQAVLLAPTEVLAQQHFASISALLGDLGAGGMLGGADDATRVVLLTGAMSAPRRRAALAEIAAGSAGIVVGTHALLSQSVSFARLGLVVVDEQHRFGVEQREVLRERATTGVHLLVMTATPIPRTIAMSVFGDLDVSALTELPAGRRPVETFVAAASNQAWYRRIWERAAEEIAQDRRVFVVVPRISGDQAEDGDLLVDDAPPAPPSSDASPGQAAGREEGDLLAQMGAAGPEEAGEATSSLASVEEVAAALGELPALAGVGIGKMHGRLSAEERAAAMEDFVSGRTPILVSTTVIEVGVDVPAATMMVILDAERFGISQLHQLRGRVGRSHLPSLCIAVTTSLPDSLAGRRLAAFASTTDGFALAEEDLALRSEGDVLGRSQSGRASSLKLLRVSRDGDLIADARGAAGAAVAAGELEKNPALRAAVERHLTDEQEANLRRS